MADIDFLPLGEFEVRYLDGSTERARSNFGAVMELEARYVGAAAAPSATVMIEALWLYLGQPKDSLKAWASTVHNFDPVKDADVNPSRPAVGDG